MFNVEASKYVNSSVINEAMFGWWEDPTDTGADYKRGIVVVLNSDARYFYPASRDEFDTLTSPQQSAGRYYNVFLKGRDGAFPLDEDEITTAPEPLVNVAASVEDFTLDGNGDHQFGEIAGENVHVALRVESTEQLFAVMQALYDNDLESCIVRVNYG